MKTGTPDDREATGPVSARRRSPDEARILARLKRLRLYRTRNDLQHASLDAQADEVYNDIVLLQKTLARFARSYMRWLDGHGAQLLPQRKVAPSAGAAEQ